MAYNRYRNYIEVGQYIDYVFPAFGIRFIAIQDNVDTENRDSGSMEMLPIMNVFNEWHAANTIRADVTAGGNTASVVYTLAENSEDAMSFRVDVVNGTETVALTFVQNKKAQTFDLTYSQVTADGTYSSTYSGSYTVSDNLFSLVLDKIDGEEFGGTVTLNLRSQDTLTVPEFTELLQLGEEEMTEAMTELLGSIQSVAEIFS